HVHLLADSPGRAWFLRETETLAALDHPAIRHVYAAGLVGSFAYRTANWVEGESLAVSLRRGPRAIPTAHALVRDLLGAADHAPATATPRGTGRARAGPAARAAGRAQRPLLHRDGDAGGLCERRRRISGAGGDASGGGGGVRTPSAARPRRRLRAARRDRDG